MKPLQSWHSELPAPAHLTRASKEVAAAWESFINEGTIVGPAPRPVVLKGWMRCREQGIDPHAERASIGMTPEELQSILHSDELDAPENRSWIGSRNSWGESVTWPCSPMLTAASSMRSAILRSRRVLQTSTSRLARFGLNPRWSKRRWDAARPRTPRARVRS